MTVRLGDHQQAATCKEKNGGSHADGTIALTPDMADVPEPDDLTQEHETSGSGDHYPMGFSANNSFWLDEIQELGCADEMYAPVPWVQHCLLLIGARNREALLRIIEVEQAPHALCSSRCQCMVDTNFSHRHGEETTEMGCNRRRNSEARSVSRPFSLAVPVRLPSSHGKILHVGRHRLQTLARRKKVPLGTWSSRDFGMNCDQPAICVCSCFNERPGCHIGRILAWLDCVLWFIMNHLEDYFPDEPRKVDRVIAFLDFLRNLETYVLQIAVGLKISGWTQAGAKQVLAKPSRTSITCVPAGPAKTRIEEILLPRHLGNFLREQALEPVITETYSSILEEVTPVRAKPYSTPLTPSTKKKAQPQSGNTAQKAASPAKAKAKAIDSDNEHEVVKKIIRNQAGRFRIENIVDETKVYVHLNYISRGFELIKPKTLYKDILIQMNLPMVSFDDNMVFGWTYQNEIRSLLYKPVEVFCEFDTDNIPDCGCEAITAFTPYLSPLGEQTEKHVKTLDRLIVQWRDLKCELDKGLNHISLCPVHKERILTELNHGWLDLIQKSPDLTCIWDQDKFPLVKRLIKNAVSSALSGDINAPADTWDHEATTARIQWLQKHLYIAGTDKAANTPSFLCIRLVRLEAMNRVRSSNFEPLLHNSAQATTPVECINSLLQEEVLLTFNPERIKLPYLMCIYKAHKDKLRWLTNAADCIFSEITKAITACLQEISSALLDLAHDSHAAICNLLRTETNCFWTLSSMAEFSINLPERVYCAFSGDISRCYEAIPLNGPDGLINVLTKLINRAWQLKRKKRQVLFLHNRNGKFSAQWKLASARTKTAIRVDADTLILWNTWAISHTFVQLGNKVWKQVVGIPMGFSCSPLWCNLYLCFYESNFIKRLERLGDTEALILFKDASRYMDDLTVLNNPQILRFLDPDQPRVKSNPYWIYPLQFLLIEQTMIDPIKIRYGVVTSIFLVLI
ncbi:hypothetical protein SELMODRAFT_425444 [Selaginella moellendorffii]|uniref:Uncharacterized protein n=1 Tax=Selaginella moellendorffii TaxID=88036 RepID=D8ST44_SELML|nr:hypothetical protein SELMODRAFT_425444 [Selaginella moellendorffii]